MSEHIGRPVSVWMRHDLIAALDDEAGRRGTTRTAVIMDGIGRVVDYVPQNPSQDSPNIVSPKAD